MRVLSDNERDQRQPHADEDHFAVANFARGSGDHELGESVVARHDLCRAALGWTGEGARCYVFIGDSQSRVVLPNFAQRESRERLSAVTN